MKLIAGGAMDLVNNLMNHGALLWIIFFNSQKNIYWNDQSYLLCFQKIFINYQKYIIINYSCQETLNIVLWESNCILIHASRKVSSIRQSNNGPNFKQWPVIFQDSFNNCSVIWKQATSSVTEPLVLCSSYNLLLTTVYTKTNQKDTF